MRNIDLLFHLFMLLFVDSYMCPDWKSNYILGMYWEDALTIWATWLGQLLLLIYQLCKNYIKVLSLDGGSVQSPAWLEDLWLNIHSHPTPVSLARNVALPEPVQLMQQFLDCSLLSPAHSLKWLYLLIVGQLWEIKYEKQFTPPNSHYI